MDNESLGVKKWQVTSSAILNLPSNNTTPNRWSDPGLRRMACYCFPFSNVYRIDATLTANFQCFKIWKEGDTQSFTRNSVTLCNITKFISSVAEAFISERISGRLFWLFAFVAMIIANIPFATLSTSKCGPCYPIFNIKADLAQSTSKPAVRK